MTISWHKQYSQSWNYPQDLPEPKGYLVPAKIQLSTSTSTDNNKLDNLHKLATEILEDPLSVVQFTERVYDLMQQDLQHQSDRFGCQQDVMY